jgi:hypothetical protein
MIASYELSKYLTAHLRLRGWPLKTVYGPVRFKPPAHKNTVIVERNRNSGDTVEPKARPALARESIGGRVMPSTEVGVAVRLMQCTATIFASSGAKGAHLGTHETLCDELVDALHCGILLWSGISKSGVTITSGRYLRADELDLLTEDPTWPGVAYQLQFAIQRGVFDRDSDGNPARRYAKIADVETDVNAVPPREPEPANAENEP